MVWTGSERVGPRHHRGTAVEHYAGIDVSLERSTVCVVDGTGKIVREAKLPSEPEALVAFFGQLGVTLTRVGLEAGPLSQWLHAGLAEAGLEAVLLGRGTASTRPGRRGCRRWGGKPTPRD